MPIVRHVKYARKQDHNVYIGRKIEDYTGMRIRDASILNNPFPISNYNDQKEREESIKQYRVWLYQHLRDTDTYRSAPYWNALRKIQDSSVLLCHCYPKHCHGNIIIKAWQWAKEQGLIEPVHTNHTDKSTLENVARANANDKTPITRFTAEAWYFSNFARVDVTLDGITYPTVEHAYQAAKTTDPDERARIQAARWPSDAKHIGRKVRLRKDWENIKLGVMEHLLRQKFAVPQYRDALLATGTRPLVEGNTWNDTFWGICHGAGDNHLGRLLMMIRSELTTFGRQPDKTQIDARLDEQILESHAVACHECPAPLDDTSPVQAVNSLQRTLPPKKKQGVEAPRKPRGIVYVQPDTRYNEIDDLAADLAELYTTSEYVAATRDEVPETETREYSTIAAMVAA